VDAIEELLAIGERHVSAFSMKSSAAYRKAPAKAVEKKSVLEQPVYTNVRD
jgi:hypothetical protein